MKKLLVLPLVVSCSFLHAQKAMEVKAPITEVKVCLNSALLTHTKSVNVKQGVSKIAFIGLASSIESRHLALRNAGSCELLGLSLYTINDTTDILSLPNELTDVLRKSKDSVFVLEKSISKLTWEIKGLELERTLLISNTDVIPSAKLVTAAEMKASADFYRERYRDVNLELLTRKKELRNLKNQKIRMLKSAFGVEADNDNTVAFNIVLAEVNNTGAAYTTDIQLIYVANGSGWIPVYEIFASGNKNLKINYRAKVLNNTGLDWSNQKVTLSTADPSEYYKAPDLEPFYINRYSRYNSYSYSKYNSRYGKDGGDEYYQDQVQQKQIINPAEEEIFTPDKEVNFTLAKEYDFRSGLIPSFVDVTVYDLTPQFFYRCAPKKEEQAYSIARIVDWEKLNLLDGEASIFNNQKFLGKTYIRPSDIDESLELPLGVMENIYVKHKLISEVSGKKVLAGKVTATQHFEIKIKNTGTEKAQVEVMDQVPVSEEKSVETSIIEITEGYEKDEENGKITWNLEINPNSEKTLILKYTVSYPKRSGYSMNQAYKKRQVRAKF